LVIIWLSSISGSRACGISMTSSSSSKWILHETPIAFFVFGGFIGSSLKRDQTFHHLVLLSFVVL
jgi:hypothetical protein